MRITNSYSVFTIDSAALHKKNRLHSPGGSVNRRGFCVKDRRGRLLSTRRSRRRCCAGVGGQTPRSLSLSSFIFLRPAKAQTSCADPLPFFLPQNGGTTDGHPGGGRLGEPWR